jgi:uncharacterized protein (TIRG00374 family)
MSLAGWLRRPIVWVPISLALLAFVIWRSRLWEAGDRLGRVDPGPILVALGISVIIPLLWAARSRALLVASDLPVGFWPLVPMTSLANTVNNLTPGSSGEVLRLYLLKAHHGVDYATGGAVVAIERLAAFGYLTASAAVAWFGFVVGLPVGLVIAAWIALAALPGAIYFAGVRPSRLIIALPGGRLLGTDRWARFAGWMERVDERIARLLTTPLHLAEFAAYTAGLFACYSAQLVLVVGALGGSVDPIAAWGVVGISLTAGILSLLPFGLGSTDLVMIALLESLGLGPAEATAATFGYRLVSTVPLGLQGVVSYAILTAALPPGGPGPAIAAAGADVMSAGSAARPDDTRPKVDGRIDEAPRR